MPVQINEVIIRTVVDNNTAAVESAAATNAAPPTPFTDIDIASMVLEIIKEKNER